MRIQRITDYQVALAILYDDEIDGNIYEDDSLKETPDLLNDYWLAAVTDENMIVGCYRVHRFGIRNWQIHAMILKEFRGEYAMPASRAVIEWCFTNIPKIMCLMAIIPDCFGNIIAHVRALGFIHSGQLKKCARWKGKVVDQHIYMLHKEA